MTVYIDSKLRELATELKCIWEDAPNSKLKAWDLVASHVLTHYKKKEPEDTLKIEKEDER